MEEHIEWIEHQLQKKNIQAQFFEFNVGSQLRKDLLTNEMIDTDKVIKTFESEFQGRKLDLVCIDYSLEDAKVNGLDILKKIHSLRPKARYLVYSSSLDNVARNVVEEYESDKDQRKLLTKIKDLARYRVEDFVARDQFNQRILDLLSKEPQSLDSIVEEKLLENGDMVFQQGYPPFSGKTLKEIVLEIQRSTQRGNEYLQEIIELAIAQVITVNS
jgi:hypothetical protein